MRIVLTVNTGVVSGAPILIEDLARGLKRRGHAVTIITPYGDMVDRYRRAGLEVIVRAPRFDLDLRYIYWLRHYLIDEQVEVLHANMLKTVVNGLIAAWLARTPKRVAHIMGTLIDWEVPWWKKWANIATNTIVSNFLATNVIALTPSIASQLVGQEYIAKSKLTVIPAGIDLSVIQRDPQYLRGIYPQMANHAIVGTFSRMTIEKNLECFIEAIPVVLQKYPETYFVLAGDGEQRTMLEEKVESLGIKDRVLFLGFQAEELKYPILSSYDVYVFPSIREGFGITLVEAMAAQIPVVVSDLPVLKDIVTDGQTGMSFKTGNSKDLALTITRMLDSSDDNRTKLVKRAYDMLEQRYTIDRMVDNYIEVYTRRLS